MTDDGVRSLIERVRSAINRHDLDVFLECFDEDYESEQPLEPERSFRGRDRVRKNWWANLVRVPDLRWDCSTPVSPRMRPGASGGGTGIAPTEGGSTYSAS